MRFVRPLVVLILVAFVSPASAQSKPISVRVNGTLVRFPGVKPDTIEGRVMVPLRGVLERLGASVEWNAEDRSLVATRGDRDVYLPVGSRLAQVEGRPVRLESPALLVGGSILVPLRFIAESLGAEVKWDYRTQTVHVSTTSRFADDPRPRPARAHRTPKE